MNRRGLRLPARRAALTALAGLALAPVLAVRAADKVLPASRSLRDELALAPKRGEPLVVMVSLKGCAPCVLVRNNYLAPMLADEHLPVVQVDMASPQRGADFGGKPTTQGALVNDWRVTVAPTLLFFGPDGREVADRLQGMSPDFYGAQLDSRLRLARQAIARA